MKFVIAFLFALTTLTAYPDETIVAKVPQVDVKSAPSIEIYCDFQCPFCARLLATLLPLAKTENRVLNFRFRHYPFHNGSQELALFFEAARIQPNVDTQGLLESLYRFQRNIAPDSLPSGEAALATLHGLNLSHLKRDMRARDIALAVKQDEQAAVALKVDHTPSVFINTTLLIGPPELIAMAVLRASPLAPLRELPPDSDDCNVCKK